MTLPELIDLHRNLYRDELSFSPSQRTPPVAYKWDEVRRMLVPDDSPLVINPLKPDQYEIPDSATQSTQVGMPMSGRMLRYLQGPGPDTPWATALRSLRGKCRRDHPYHRAADRPYWRGSLCWQLVFMTVIGKPKGDGPATIQEAAEILRYDNPEPVLRTALGIIEDSMDEARRKAEKRSREDEGRGPGAVPDERPRPCYHQDCKGRPHFEEKPHPDHPWHQAECPNPTCRERSAA